MKNSYLARLEKLSQSYRETKQEEERAQQRIQDSKSDYSDEGFMKIVREHEARVHENARVFSNEVDMIQSEFNAEIKAWGTLDTTHLPSDAGLLNSGFALTQAEVNDLAVKHSGNYTMLRLLQKYCVDNRLVPPVFKSADDKMQIFAKASGNTKSLASVDTGRVLLMDLSEDLLRGILKDVDMNLDDSVTAGTSQNQPINFQFNGVR